MSENNPILSFDKDYRVFISELKEKVRITMGTVESIIN